MEELQQVVYRYTVQVGEELQIPWHLTSKVVHTAILDGEPEYVHFWVRHPVPDSGVAPFYRNFYVVSTGHLFPHKDIVEGVAVWEGPPRLVWQLVRREPGHTYN